MKITHGNINIQHTTIEFDKSDVEKAIWKAALSHIKEGHGHVVKEFHWQYDSYDGKVTVDVKCQYPGTLRIVDG